MSELIDRLEDCDIWLSDGGTPKDRDVLREAIVRIVEQAETNRLLCRELDEAQKVLEARDDQAAIDKDFIRQYQEQVEELQAELKQANEAIDKMMAVEKARVKAGGEPWAQPQESDSAE